MSQLRPKITESLIPEGLNGGFTLIETLVSLSLLLVVIAGLVPLFSISMHANQIDKINLQLLNSGRAKLEQIQSIPYDQVGINASGTASGPGYFVVDPIYSPVYSTAHGDLPLSDTVTLHNGTLINRTITVTAVDDPTDGTGSNDSDGVTDPNTGTILDYKLVTVTTSTTVNNTAFTQSMSTILQGNLDSEIDASTGSDSDGSPVPKSPGKGKTGPGPGGKTPPPPKSPPPPDGCDSPSVPLPKGPGRAGKSPQTGC